MLVCYLQTLLNAKRVDVNQMDRYVYQIAGETATSLMIKPRIPQFTMKKASDDSHKPGTYVLCPKNSSPKPCCSQAAWVTTHNAAAMTPSFLFRSKLELGRYNGRNTIYHRKYFSSKLSANGLWRGIDEAGERQDGYPRYSTYLAGAHLVERDEGECLRQHGGGQVLLRHDKRDENAGEQKLREKCDRLDTEGRGARIGRSQIQENVVRAEVVPVVDSSHMVEIGMFKEWLPVADQINAEHSR